MASQDNMTFEFDHVFEDNESSETVYNHTAMPLVAYMFQKKGHGTVFAYGQTGRCVPRVTVLPPLRPAASSTRVPGPPCAPSGKTYTMSSITEFVARDVFRALESREFRGKGYSVHVSFFEIYGARCTDLLHDRNKVGSWGRVGRGEGVASIATRWDPGGEWGEGRGSSFSA